jgi:hypothetical protein
MLWLLFAILAHTSTNNVVSDAAAQQSRANLYIEHGQAGSELWQKLIFAKSVF